jgi:hypothetical protein
MAKNVTTLVKEELSSTTLEEFLDGGNLPEEFKKLSPRKQKEIIFSTVMATYKQLAETMTFRSKAELASKKLRKELKLNPTQMKLAQLNKQIKETKTDEMTLLARYDGMKRLAMALGFNEKLLSGVEDIV